MMLFWLSLAVCLLYWSWSRRDDARQRLLAKISTEFDAIKRDLTPTPPRRLTLPQVQAEIARYEAHGGYAADLRMQYAQELLDIARAEGRIPPVNPAAIRVSRSTPPVSQEALDLIAREQVRRLNESRAQIASSPQD